MLTVPFVSSKMSKVYLMQSSLDNFISAAIWWGDRRSLELMLRLAKTTLGASTNLIFLTLGGTFSLILCCALVIHHRDRNADKV